MAQLTLELAKERHKFSCAHVTVFPDGTKEALHGHNYQIACSFRLAEKSLATMIPFSILKDLIQHRCDEVDEKFLVPGKCEQVTIASKDGESEIFICGKRYVIPEDEVALLPVANLTTEHLAEHFTTMLARDLSDHQAKHPDLNLITGMTITIWETNGQGASYSLDF